MFCGLVFGSMAYVFGLAQTRRTKAPFMRGTELSPVGLWVSARTAQWLSWGNSVLAACFLQNKRAVQATSESRNEFLSRSHAVIIMDILPHGLSWRSVKEP